VPTEVFSGTENPQDHLLYVSEIDRAIAADHFMPTLRLDEFVRAETDLFQEP